MPTETLIPAIDMARASTVRFPNESAEYRAARTAILAEEIELRRHLERVAAMRRALPPGGAVTGDYRFLSESRETDIAGLFGDKQTLVIYSFMFGPQRARPCPMCTALLGPLNANANDIGQHVSLVVVARSPLEKVQAFAKERGWQDLRLVQDMTDAYSRDYNALAADGSEGGVFNIFTRRDGTIRHFIGDEMSEADPGQDQRGAPELAPLWNVLDQTPDGRAVTWYPKLEY
jgi:predicted dithiol-disulfide oxidoreductase (DUF899 family)